MASPDLRSSSLAANTDLTLPLSPRKTGSQTGAYSLAKGTE